MQSLMTVIVLYRSDPERDYRGPRGAANVTSPFY